MLVLKSGVDLYFLTRSVSEEIQRITASLTLSGWDFKPLMIKVNSGL